MSKAIEPHFCDCCAHKEYTKTLCSECADRFCLRTCGQIFAYEHHVEPTVCPKCGKLHDFSYFESSFGLHIPQVSS